jgi:ELWxxDGT repeat protein
MKNYSLLFLFALLSHFMAGQSKLKLVKDLYPGSFGSLSNSYGYDSRLYALNGKLFMVADEGKYGEELYQYDPTIDSIYLVKDIRSGTGYAQIFQMQSFNNKLIFACDDKIHGLELWVSDGTNLGTFQLKEINSQGAGVYEYASRFALCPSGIFFTGIGSTEGEELWITDGTSSGTKIVKDLVVGSKGSYPSSLFYHPTLKLLFYSAESGTTGSEPHVSDGTPGGTKLFKDIIAGGNSSPFAFAAFNDKIMFSVYSGFDFNNGNRKYDAYVSDGTPTGTFSIHSKSFNLSDPRISNYTTLGNRCIFSSLNSLYSTDGTMAGTKLITDKLLITEDNEFTVYNNKIIFIATDSTHGQELFITDGTIAGTQLLKDVNPGKPSASIYNLTFYGNKLYFIATTELEGRQVWETDGTTAGTKLSFRVNKTESSYVSNLTVLDKSLYFIANDGVTGSELWVYTNEITGTKNTINNFDFTIYPNPNNGTMTFRSNEPISSIDISDMYGKIYPFSNINTTEFKLNIDLPAGLYFAKMKLNSSNIMTSEFLVIR